MSCAAATGNNADDEEMEMEEGADATSAGAANPSDWWLGIIILPIRGAAAELNEFSEAAPASGALPGCRLSSPPVLALMLVPAPGPPRPAEEDEDDEAAMVGAECVAPRASSSCS